MPVFQPQIIGNGQSGEQIQYKVLPVATEADLGKVIQYIGEDIPEVKTNATISQTVGSSLSDLTVDLDRFVETENPTEDMVVDFVANVDDNSGFEASAQFQGYNCYAYFDTEKLVAYIAQYTDHTDYRYVSVRHNDENNNSITIYMKSGAFPSGWGSFLLAYKQINSITDSDLENIVGITLSDYTTYSSAKAQSNWVDSVVTWKKDGEIVVPSSYGIGFTGNPENGDTLEVSYTSYKQGYNKGYFYIDQSTYTDPIATISQTVGSGLTELSVDVDAFIEAEQPVEDETVDFIAEVIPGHYECNEITSTGTTITCTDFEGLISALMNYTGWSYDYARDNLMSQCNYTYYVNNIPGERQSIWFSYSGGDTGWLPDGFLDPYFTFSPEISNNDVRWSGVYVSETFVGWKKDGEFVNINNYGVSYYGNPQNNDKLTVNYIAPIFVEYRWNQLDTQPSSSEDVSSGIEWKTQVDLPANYSGPTWSCTPIYTIPGGLPDGKYEFYWQTLTYNSYADPRYPLGKATYKFEIGITTNGSNRTCSGWVGYVIDGSWMPSGNYSITNNTYYSMFSERGNDLVIFTTSNMFRSDIPGYMRGYEIPGCFKLSAIKNLDTGKEYIATGILYNGTSPSYDKMYDGYIETHKLQEDPYVPQYHGESRITFNDNSQYIRISPYVSIYNNLVERVSCSELDIAIASDGGDKYHVIIENGVRSYEARVLEASGVFENTQIGWDNYGNTFLFLNTPQNTNGYLTINVGVKGASEGASAWMDNPSGFHPAIITKVGGTITKNILGKIEQYTGTSNSTYKNGYFYKATGTPVVEEVINNSYYDGENVNVTISDVGGFIDTVSSFSGWSTDTVKNHLNNGHSWRYNLSSNDIYWSCWGTFDSEQSNTILQYISFSPNVSNWTAWTSVYSNEEVIQNPRWKQVNVQPAGSGEGQIIQYEEVPEAEEENVGQILQYIGETDESYTNGYFYKNNPTYTDPAATISQTTGVIDSVSFETTVGNIEISGTTETIRNLSAYFRWGLTSSDMIITRTGEDSWDIRGQDPAYGGFQSSVSDEFMYQRGFTITGTPQNGDTVVCSYTLGNIYNIALNIDKFIGEEQPTQDESVNFVASVSIKPEVLYGSYDDASCEIIDTALFIQKIEEKWASYGFGTEAYGYGIGIDTDAGYNKIAIWINDNSSSAGFTIEQNEAGEWGLSFNAPTVFGSQVTLISPFKKLKEKTIIWYKNGTDVNIRAYGIFYSGSPADGDVLTVVYTAPIIIGYDWNQLDVQPSQDNSSVGIEWKTKVDFPAEYQGSVWSCLPYWTIRGGLPDGKYEFYFSTKCTSRGDIPEIPYGEVIFKVLLNINNTNNTAYGNMGYVFNGDYVADGNYVFGGNDRDFHNAFHKNGDDLILWYTAYPFTSDIPAYLPTLRFVPECWKLSAFKNLDTGEEYIAEGTLKLDGSGPIYQTDMNGYLHLCRIMDQPYIPRSAGTARNNVTEFTDRTIFIGKNYQTCTLHLQHPNSESELLVNVTGKCNSETLVPYSQEIVKATGLFANCYLACNNNYIIVMGVDTASAGEQTGKIYTSVGGANIESGSSIWFDTIPEPNTLTLLPQVGPQGNRLGTITAETIGNIIQYTGTTNANYTNGYYYKAAGTTVYVPSSLIMSDFEPNDCSVEVDADSLIPALVEYLGWSEQNVKNHINNGYNWTIYWNSDNNTFNRIYWGAVGDMYSSDVMACFTVSTTGSYSGEVAISAPNTTFTESHYDVQNGHWEQVNVQPSSGGDDPNVIPPIVEANYSWGIDRGEASWIVVKTAREQPEVGDYLYHGTTGKPIQGITTVDGELFVPYPGWLRVASYDPNDGGITISANGVIVRDIYSLDPIKAYRT